MSTTDDLIDRYYDWLKAKTHWREINDWVEITTPYLDRHNDHIQLYLKRQDGEWVLTDDGTTLADLAQSGCEIDTPRCKALLAATLAGFGVRQNFDALEVRATEPKLSAVDRSETVLALTPDEVALLDNYRNSSEEDKDTIKRIAFVLAKQKTRNRKPTKKQP